MSSRSGSSGGWRVRRSIALELQVATNFVHLSPPMLPKRLIDLAMTIPPSHLEELRALDPARSPGAEQRPIFEYLARWAQVQCVEDYDEASGAMRELTINDAIAQVTRSTGLSPADDLEPTERLLDLELQVYAELVHLIGLYPSSDLTMLERERNNVLAAVQFLRDGPLHSRFWHWMDRFFYETYRPWRTARLDAIERLEQTAIDGLGGREGSGPPALDWLPPTHVLVAIPTARAAVEAGEFEIVFWAEPFELESDLTGAPGMFMTSFAEHGIDYEYSIAVRDDLTAKLKALSDPTRMDILRMIRNLDADNTQIAGWVGVSRPTVSVHAKALAEAGFISTERDGRQARHSFHPDAVREFCEDLMR